MAEDKPPERWRECPTMGRPRLDLGRSPSPDSGIYV
jgi:hypothetical protein